MSGHSKWSTIKHKKAKTDAQRGKIFTKLGREITMAAKIGGADPEMNPRLRLAIQKAKDGNMPNDNIKRSTEKGAGTGDESNLEEISFEAYAPHGVGLIIEVVTDNRNRSVANVKHVLSRSNSSIATPGAVSYQFHRKGLFLFSPESSEEAIMEIALEHNAEDILTKDDNSIEVICEPNDFEPMRTAFETAQLPFENAEVSLIPETTIELDSKEKAESVLALIEKLEDDDDVQTVHGNFDIPETILTTLL